MLLAMQPVKDYETGQFIQPGLTPDDLHGYKGTRRDAFIIDNQISDFLQGRNNIPEEKQKLMMSSFRNVIESDLDRDELQEKHRHVAKLIPEDKASYY